MNGGNGRTGGNSRHVKNICSSSGNKGYWGRMNSKLYYLSELTRPNNWLGPSVFLRRWFRDRRSASRRDDHCRHSAKLGFRRLSNTGQCASTLTAGACSGVSVTAETCDTTPSPSLGLILMWLPKENEVHTRELPLDCLRNRRKLFISRLHLYFAKTVTAA